MNTGETTMTIEEIQAELDKMPAALSAAGWVCPKAHIWVRANELPTAYISADMQRSQFFTKDTFAECIAAAWEFIRALPDPQAAILATYSRKLADAIDYGHENNVPAKLVDPVRRAQKATSAMMLPAPAKGE
jgi:hypothetical protein